MKNILLLKETTRARTSDMEGMLVLIIDPRDPRLYSVSDSNAHKPEFGIVERVLDTSGRYFETRISVRCNEGRTEVFPLGRLIPLLRLPEHDAYNVTFEEIVAKWAVEIIARVAFFSLPQPQRAFLKEERALRRRR